MRLKTLPRPTGKATHVIITEYDLPRPTIEPHDVIVDEHGMVWYTDFGEEFIGKLDPKTGALKEYPVPHSEARLSAGLAGHRGRQGRKFLGRHDVSGRASRSSIRRPSSSPRTR